MCFFCSIELGSEIIDNFTEGVLHMESGAGTTSTSKVRGFFRPDFLSFLFLLFLNNLVRFIVFFFVDTLIPIEILAARMW